MTPRPPHPLDLAYWTLEAQPQFDVEYFTEDTLEYVEKYGPLLGEGQATI